MDENDNHSYWFVCPCETNIPPTYLPLSFLQLFSNYKLAFKSSSTFIFLFLLLFAHVWIPKKQKYVTNLIIIFQCGLDDLSMTRKAIYSSQMKSLPPTPNNQLCWCKLLHYDLFIFKFITMVLKNPKVQFLVWFSTLTHRHSPCHCFFKSLNIQLNTFTINRVKDYFIEVSWSWGVGKVGFLWPQIKIWLPFGILYDICCNLTYLCWALSNTSSLVVWITLLKNIFKMSRYFVMIWKMVNHTKRHSIFHCSFLKIISVTTLLYTSWLH